MKNPLVENLLAVAHKTGFYKDLDSGDKDILYARQIVQLHWKKGTSWAVSSPGMNTLLVPSKDLIAFKDPVAASRKYKAGEYYGTKNPIHPEALESLKRYKADLKAGHTDAAEYWRGQAGAYFTANPKGSRVIPGYTRYLTFPKIYYSTIDKVKSELGSVGVDLKIVPVGEHWIVYVNTAQFRSKYPGFNQKGFGYKPNPAYGVGMTAMTKGTAPISALDLSTGKRELALFPRQAVRLLEKVGNSWVVTTGRKDVLLVPAGNISLRSNPILADLGASALAGFGLAAGWKGFEWALKKVKGKKSKSIAHKVARRNPWLYPWQREKR